MSVSAPAVKKIVNDPEDVVPEALAGVAAAHPGLVRVDFEHQLIIRAEAPVATTRRRCPEGQGYPLSTDATPCSLTLTSYRPTTYARPSPA